MLSVYGVISTEFSVAAGKNPSDPTVAVDASCLSFLMMVLLEFKPVNAGGLVLLVKKQRRKGLRGCVLVLFCFEIVCVWL